MNKTNERIATWPLVETSWLAEHLSSSDALALTLLDIQDVAVYHEGLIEWTADPELPMEAG